MTMDYLIISGIESVIAVTEFRFEVKPSEHAKAFLTCLAAEELPCDILNKQIVSVYYQKEEEKKLLWKGVVQQFIQRKEGMQMEIQLRLISASIWFDQRKCTRTFQDTEQSYESMLKTIAAGYSEADILFAVRQKECEKIQDLILQYQETDWEFMKRIASHFHSVLIPDITTGKSKLYFGIPNGVSEKEVFPSYTLSIDNLKAV